MRPSIGLAVAASAFALLLATSLSAQRTDAFMASRDHPAIQYSDGPATNRISALNQKIQDGQARLSFDPVSGYLRSVLDALSVPVESQITVFSQTSLQSSKINPANPRAIFFDDAVAVAWVRGGSVVEVAAHDPRQGGVFYTLDQTASDKPQFKRNDGCLLCHLSWETAAVPGFFVLSTAPMPDDKDAYATGLVSDHRVPLAQRWGSWYVSGRVGSARHAGNVTTAAAASKQARPPELGALNALFDTTGYLSPYSDVVALMVLEHQTHLMNLITWVGWETRVAAHDGGKTPDRVGEAVRQFVDYLLFVDEAPLPGKIQGVSGFAEKFSARGPRDSQGRSLRDLDLTRRLLRYPCSYLIYSEAFDALPAAARDAIYARMWEILSGRDRQGPYAALLLADRRAIVEILRDTKKDLPDYFQPVTR